MKSRLSNTVLASIFAGFIAIACMGVVGVPGLGMAEETSSQNAQQAVVGKADGEQAGISYVHNPLYNPSCMRDVVVNPDAVYGFSPNPDSGSLTKFAAYDWTDPDVVGRARQERLEYFASMQEMTDLMNSMVAEGKSIEEIARAVSAKRNEIRLASYKGDEQGLAAAKAHNLEKYGNENGPTPEYLYNMYGSWESVLDHAFSSNSGMDACCGLYDQNYEKYKIFGQIPSYQVRFDVAGRGEAPASQTVYAGECATEPAAPQVDGYEFLGWYAEGSTEAFDFSAPIAQDTVLVAAWDQRAFSSVVLGEDAPVASASANLDAAMLLSHDEQDLVDEGESARVWLEVGKGGATQEVQDDLTSAAASRLGAGSQVACFVDLGIWKQFATDDAPIAVRELSDALVITLSLADEQVPADADRRSWCVSREHDGVVDVLDATFDAKTKSVSFSSDKFSSFAIAYGAATEQATSGSSTKPKQTVPYLSRTNSSTASSKTSSTPAVTPSTGDPTSIAALLACFVGGSSLTAAGLGIGKRR